jgi:hypothetical protein
MTLPTRRTWRGQSGLVGKILVVWLLLVGLVAVVAVDAASVAITTFRLSDTASNAATAGAAVLRGQRARDRVCEDARDVIEAEEPDLVIGRAFCKVDLQTETVTITLKQRAPTILAGRLSFSEDLTTIVVKETGRPSGV